MTDRGNHLTLRCIRQGRGQKRNNGARLWQTQLVTVAIETGDDM